MRKYIQNTHSILLSILLLIQIGIAEAQNVTIQINATQNLRKVSPTIYGANNFLNQPAQFYKDAGLRFARLNGGNDASAYNWTNGLAVHPDWYNNVYSDNWDASAKIVNDSFSTLQGMFAFQLLGRVASNNQNNFNDWAYNQSQYWSGVCQNLAGNGTPNSAGGCKASIEGDCTLFSKPWPADSSVAILDHWFGTNGKGYDKTKFQYWNMDNECDVWNGTHDWAMPTLISASAFLDRWITLAKKAKAKYPGIKLCGPVTTSEWQYYKWSNENIYVNGVYYPYMEYFIKRLSDVYDSTGMKLVDVIDIHNYPSYNTDAEALQGHRFYYDTVYSYPGANGIKTSTGGWDPSLTNEYFFKRVNDWLNKHFGPNHGITTGVSEWGPSNKTNDPNIVSTIYASHLGTFANNGVECFSPWIWSTGMWETIHLFSRYAQGFSVSSTSSLEDTLSAYTTVNAANDSMTVMIVNRSMNNSQTVTVNLSNFTVNNGSYNTLQLSSLPGTETFVSHTQNALKKNTVSVNSNSFTITVPKLSTTAILLSSPVCNTSAPTVTSPVIYCQNTTASALTATGTSLKWYTSATGGTASTTAPTPSTATTGTTTYYVSQTVGCEGPRASIAVTVNALPVIYTYTQINGGTWANGNSAAVCSGSSVSFGPQPGGTWAWTGPNGFTSTNRQIDLTNIAASNAGNYISTYTDANGCKASATNTLTVNATPSAPTVTSPVTYCQTATASALTATGTSLLWYTSSSGGTGSTTAPTPSTTTVGTTSYYVSQTNASGCEGPRATIAVTVNTTPSAPAVTSPVTYCQNTTASALTATGASLLWYTSSSGGTGSTTAPTPTTTTTGTTSYYVSQTNASNCESPRAAITVKVDASPSASNAGTTQNITVTTATLAANNPSTGIGSWSVVSGTGSFANSASANTSVSGLSQGTNIFQWTISNGVCPSSNSSVTINVGSAPASQTVTGSVNVQDNATGIIYSVPATAGVSKVWTVPTGAIITSYNSDSSQITVDFGTTSGTVSVDESNTFGSTTSSLFVAVGNGPAQQTLTGPVYVSSNTSATYSITTPSGVTNHWTVPVGATITSSNTDSSQVTISFGSTEGTVSVTQTNSFGSTLDSETINVGSAPVTQTVSGPAYIATGSTGITYSIPDNSGSTYHWTLPLGTTIASANADSSLITVSFGNTVENGTIAVTETNPYGFATSSLTVSVGNAPSSQSISGTDSVTANETGVVYSVPDNSGSTYHWTLPSGATITSANADSSQITVSFGTTGGTVSVTENNPYGSATSSTTVGISTVTGIIMVGNRDSYMLYPNPFSETATLRVNSLEKEQITISIIDVNSVVIYSSTGHTNEDIVLGKEILASGIYCIQIICNDYIKVLKLVKD